MTNSKSLGHVMASQLNCLKNLYMKFNPGNADQKILIYLFLIFLLDSF